MNTTTDIPPPPNQAGPAPNSADQGPRVSRDQMRDVNRLRRTRGPHGDRKIAGVAGGLARHFDIDPLLVRILLVVLVFFGGSGLLIYLGVWAFVPTDGRDDAPVNLTLRSRSVALVAIAGLAGLALLGDLAAGWGFPWGLVVVGVIIVAVLQFSRSNDQAGSVAPAHAPPPPTDGSAPPSDYAAGYTPPPARPRRWTGPILFWPTLALVAVVLGTVGFIDSVGADVTPSVYPAAGLATVAAMLLVGSVWGRAGGLIALGFLFAIATAITTAAEEVDVESVSTTPRTAAQVNDRYEFGAGEFVLDLSQLDDSQALDGRTIEVFGDLGDIEVIVPDDVDVDATATIRTIGGTEVFGSQNNGTQGGFRDADGPSDADTADLEIDVSVAVGEITIRSEND